jgi:predicted lipoprotein with Yx(FWY)xxD motif/plastocyanin
VNHLLSVANKKTPAAFLGLIMLVLVLASCAAPATPVPPTQAPAAPTATTAPAPTATTAPAPAAPAATKAATVMITKNDMLGQILTDDEGKTLYLYTKDTKNTSVCYDKCAQAWPPLLTAGAPKAGDGADAALLGTTARTDGTTQVTYNGWPLYYYVKDQKPGDVTGQDVGGVWYMLSSKGDKIETSVATASSAPAPAGQAKTVRVAIKNFSFGAPLTIAVGTTVVWTNDDAAPHTVTASDGTFDSGNLDKGASYSFTFTQEGTYSYVCQYHSDMKGQIVVTK